MRLRSLIGLALVLCSPSALAQTVTAVPSVINFQGRLATPSGNPVPDGTYAIRFSLWDAAANGTEKWNKTISDVAVRNGAFAVKLDSLAADTFNGSLWFEIKIGNDAALAPRQQLVSVPYALKSNLALTVPDGTITNAKLAGAITADKLASGTLNGTAWLLSGNSGTNPTTNFLGTTDNNPLEFRVNGYRAIRYTFAEDLFGFPYRSINTLGGSNVNEIETWVVGATIAGGGRDNIDNSIYSDEPNRALHHFTTIGGGYGNTASEFMATIGGGLTNRASSGYTTIAGGSNNFANGYISTVSGGIGNGTGGLAATVSGGEGNNGGGNWSVVPGGKFNRANGNYSFAAGRRASANHNGAFVWADEGSPADGTEFPSTGANQFLVRAAGGVGINTNDPAGYALKVNGSVAGVGNYQNLSDARFKQKISPFDNALNAILGLRGVTFEWKPTDSMNFSEGRQIGFIAQEVEKVLPELVMTDQNGVKSVAYANVVPVLVEAIKTQQKKIEALEKQTAEIAEIRAQVAELLAAMHEMKAIHGTVRASRK
jgi:hypothetical protein